MSVDDVKHICSWKTAYDAQEKRLRDPANRYSYDKDDLKGYYYINEDGIAMAHTKSGSAAKQLTEALNGSVAAKESYSQMRAIVIEFLIQVSSASPNWKLVHERAQRAIVEHGPVQT